MIDSTDAPGPARPAERPGGLLLDLSLVGALVAWLCGTPALWYMAAITAAPFFGELPTEAEYRESAWLLLGALATAFVVPLAAALVAAFTRRRGLAAVFAVALLASCAAGAAAGIVTPDGFRHVEEQLWPDEPTPEQTRGPVCQERSGGDTRCPGG